MMLLPLNRFPDWRGVMLTGVVLLFMSAAVDAHAQDLEPRSYANTPVDLNFFFTSYAYMEGEVLPDPSLPVEDVRAEVHTTIVGYTRSLDVLGKSGKLQVILPYAWLDVTGDIEGQAESRKVDGFTDPRFRFSVNLIGAPALSLKEYGDYEQDTIFGVSMLVTAPYGQYNSDRLINIGTNRWSFKPEIGISKALKPWTLELSAASMLFTDNRDYFGGMTREQDPIYSFQGHVIYDFGSSLWGSLDATYYTGGRTTIDGVRKDDLQKNWRVGMSFSLPLDRRNSIKLYASRGVFTRTGTDFDLIGIGWQYRWGGGL
jgi:hypothetical protein